MLAAAEQLEEVVSIISAASTELAAQVEQSDKGAAESSQRLAEAATAMNEMNATVQEVARNASDASSMFLLLMDEFKKSREHRFSVADVRLVVRECLCEAVALNARSAEIGAALVREVEGLLAGTPAETPLLQVFARRVFRHERCEVFIKTFRQAAEIAKKVDPANKTEYYDIVCNSMSDAEEALLFLCAVARNGVQALADPQVMKLRESYDEIRDRL